MKTMNTTIKKDLRRHSRINIHTMCTFYALKTFELPATILNISESGVMIELEYNKDLFQSLKENDTVLFQGIDLNDERNDRIFQEKATVKRIEQRDNKLNIACAVSELDKYYNNYVAYLKSTNHN